jgi:alkylation response protein AidB-like acyl-CoA dehydrogenase
VRGRDPDGVCLDGSRRGLGRARPGQRARRDGDHYVLNGGKKFITRATTADWLMVIARMEQGDGFIGLLVARDAPGVHISAEVGKLGWFGVPISTLAFTDVRVPATHRLGEEGDGFALAQDALLRARIGHAAMALGRAIGAVEIAATYACDRSTFGKPLGEHQGVQWMLADMVTQIEASRALVFVPRRNTTGGTPTPPPLPPWPSCTPPTCA